MFIRFTLPNGNTIDSDICSGYSLVEQYHNDLKPVDDSFKCTVPFTVTMANAIKSFINRDIKAVVYDDGTEVYSGYLRKTASLSKAVLNDNISVELVPASFLIDVNYISKSTFKDKTVGNILSTIFTDMEYDFQIVNAPNKTIKFLQINEESNIKNVVTQLLYEIGYVFSFNTAGNMVFYPLFDSVPSTITQTFTDGDNGNMYGKYSQSVKERQYDCITAEFNEIEYRENQTIFDDTSEKTLNPGNWLFDNSTGEYVKYDCDGVQSVLYVDSASVSLTVTGTVSKTFQNYYTKGLLSVQNTSSSQIAHINRIKVTGSGYFVTATSQSKTAEGKKTKEFKLSYTFDKTDAEYLVRKVADYYKYSAVKLTLKSKSDFSVGSFCSVTAAGTGTYTGRIIKKTKTNTTDLISYEIESVLEYVPATSSTDTSHESNTGNFYDIISYDGNVTPTEKQVLKKEWLTIQEEKTKISVNAEAAGVTTAVQYITYVSNYNSLASYLTSTSMFTHMDTVTAISSRSQFNQLFTEYYSSRDAINEKITQAYVDSQSGTSSKDAIPVMVISAPVVKVQDTEDVWTGYSPAAVTFYGKMTNGDYSSAYMGIYEVYVNGSETPAYKSDEPELGSSWTIEDGTTSIRLIMRNSLGDIIFDREDIDFITADSGPTLHISNKYQAFYSGSLADTRSGEGAYFETAITAYNGLEQRPVHIGEIEETQGITFRSSGNTLYIFPTGEINDSGTIEISATIETTDGKVFGVVNDGVPVVVGLRTYPYTLGQYTSDYLSVSFTYVNIDNEEQRYGITNNSGKYYGAYSNIDDVPNIIRKGDYILYTGTTTDQYKKGLTYVFNGVNLVLDDSKEHQIASITDMLAMLDENTDGDALALLLVDRLVSNTAFINRLISNNIFTRNLEITYGGSISGNYTPNEKGFLLNSDGYFECNNGKFVGDIDAGMIQISHMSPGIITISYDGISVFQFCDNLKNRDFIEKTTYYGEGSYNDEVINQFWYDYTTSATTNKTVEVWRDGGTEKKWGWPSGSLLPTKGTVRLINYYKYNVATTQKRVKIVFGDKIIHDTTYTLVVVSTLESYTRQAYSTTSGFSSNYEFYVYGGKVYSKFGYVSSNGVYGPGSPVNMTFPQSQSYNPGNIGDFDFYLNTESPTFKMQNVPLYSDNLADWSVYRTNDGILKIKMP